MRTRLQVALGGPAGNLENFTSATNARLPLVIVALALAVALTLAIALRAVVLPVVAVLANLLTAAAAFGVLSLLFSGSNPPLGGPGYLDPMSIVGIFAVVFGISLIHLFVLLMRTREELVAGVDVDGALDTALRRTAAASTGAGLLMIAALIPFATGGLVTVRELGIGVAVAVALDVFLVRPVLLPATVAVLGPAAWWPTEFRQIRTEKPQSAPMGGPGGGRRVGPIHPTAVVTFPKNTKFNFKSSAVKQCAASATELIATKGAACPSKSKIGSGTATANGAPVYPKIPETATVFVGKGNKLIFLLAPTAAVGAPLVLEGSVSANKLTTPVPALASGGLTIVIVELNVSVKTVGSGKQAFVTAGQCSNGKFTVKSNFHLLQRLASRAQRLLQMQQVREERAMDSEHAGR